MAPCVSIFIRFSVADVSLDLARAFSMRLRCSRQRMKRVGESTPTMLRQKTSLLSTRDR